MKNRINLQVILEKLGLTDIDLKTKAEEEAFKKQLDIMIAEAEAEEKGEGMSLDTFKKIAEL